MVKGVKFFQAARRAVLITYTIVIAVGPILITRPLYAITPYVNTAELYIVRQGIDEMFFTSQE